MPDSHNVHKSIKTLRFSYNKPCNKLIIHSILWENDTKSVLFTFIPSVNVWLFYKMLSSILVNHESQTISRHEKRLHNHRHLSRQSHWFRKQNRFVMDFVPPFISGGRQKVGYSVVGYWQVIARFQMARNKTIERCLVWTPLLKIITICVESCFLLTILVWNFIITKWRISWIVGFILDFKLVGIALTFDIEVRVYGETNYFIISQLGKYILSKVFTWYSRRW